MVYSESLEGNPDVNPGEGETARETARFFYIGQLKKMRAIVNLTMLTPTIINNHLIKFRFL